MIDWVAALVPARLPEVEGADLVATYMPGSRGEVVRGDWYDVHTLDDGTLVLAIGDVVGRGGTAASLVERLRRALRMYAHQGLGPAALLARLNALTTDLRSEMSTVVVLAYDPRTGRLVGANAGHPPAFIRRRSGSVVRWDACRGLPLGVVAGGRWLEEELVLAPGDLVLLYTDGLIERRGVPVAEALDLVEGSVGLAPTAVALRAAVIDAMLGGDDDHDDDVAVLVLGVRAERVPAPPG